MDWNANDHFMAHTLFAVFFLHLITCTHSLVYYKVNVNGENRKLIDRHILPLLYVHIFSAHILSCACSFIFQILNERTYQKSGYTHAPCGFSIFIGDFRTIWYGHDWIWLPYQQVALQGSNVKISEDLTLDMLRHNTEKLIHETFL